jgi:hypothetical protein
MTERPDHALVLDVSRVLRELSERQREMLDVIRRLRVDLSATSTSAELPVAPGPNRIGLMPGTDSAPMVIPRDSVVSVLSAPVLIPLEAPDPLPIRPTTAAVTPTTAVEPSEAPVTEQSKADVTLSTTRDYDYFDELDRRLARVREDSETREQ